MMKILKKSVYYVLALVMLSAVFSCEDDDTLNIIAGLDFNIAELNAEGNEIGVIATTIPPDGRIVYTVNFGDPSGDPTEVIQETSGPMVSYEYPEETATYTIMVTASLPGRDDVSITKEYTVIYAIEDPDPDPLPQEAYANDDFEGDDGITSWFADAITMDTAFANPDASGINTSATVLQYIDDGSGLFANIRFDVDPNFDLASNSTFTLKVYVESSSITGSQPNQIALKLQDGGLSEPWTTQTEIIKPVVLDQWQEITFDFANDPFVNFDPGSADPVDRTDFNRVVIQFNGENNNDAITAYIDDLVYDDTIAGPPEAYANDDFEGDDGIASWFADAVIMDTAFTNPDDSGINTSATVLQYIDDGSGAFANIRFDVDPNFDIASNPTFTLKAYIDSSSISGSQPNQVALKLQNNELGGDSWQTQTEIVRTINVLDEWVELTFDFSGSDWVNINFLGTDPDPVDRTDFNRVVIQFNGENNNDTVTAYIDDLVYE
ncbi:hypothetical protein [Winogradskyella sp.]|uniref:hypothetical protein n=1 Tax=Winogradskyella sp. TaxID=1883156 RepID=UPI00260A27BC|nr:hypothetical protein [Winogradskyella sp.]